METDFPNSAQDEHLRTDFGDAVETVNGLRRFLSREFMTPFLAQCSWKSEAQISFQNIEDIACWPDRDHRERLEINFVWTWLFAIFFNPLHADTSWDISLRNCQAPVQVHSWSISDPFVIYSNLKSDNLDQELVLFLLCHPPTTTTTITQQTYNSQSIEELVIEVKTNLFVCYKLKKIGKPRNTPTPHRISILSK